jgi:hypothetical protein
LLNRTAVVFVYFVVSLKYLPHKANLCKYAFTTTPVIMRTLKGNSARLGEIRIM